MGSLDDRNVASSDQPRLAVFTRADGEWKMQAIANLGAGLITDPAEAGRKAVEAFGLARCSAVLPTSQA